MAEKRGNARVCGQCYVERLRPDMYEPVTYIEGACSLCGDPFAFVHRVSWAEIDSYREEIAREELTAWNQAVKDVAVQQEVRT